MLIACGLLLLSLVFIYIEFFLPGTVFALVGACSFVGSVALFYRESPHDGAIALFVVIGLLGIWGVIHLALYKIKKSKDQSFYLKSTQEGFVASSFDKELIGLQGKTISELRPSGFILVGKDRYQAISEGEFIPKETAIEIMRGQGSHLVVRKIPLN